MYLPQLVHLVAIMWTQRHVTTLPPTMACATIFNWQMDKLVYVARLTLLIGKELKVRLVSVLMSSPEKMLVQLIPSPKGKSDSRLLEIPLDTVYVRWLTT